MLVLGIETSCDETAVALYDDQKGLLSHALYSQIKLHAEFGGVVPELASRDHVRKILPLMSEALAQAALKKEDIDGVAYTAGPGLAGALLVGVSVGRSLAWTLGVPALAVNHMEGHLLAPMLENDAPEFPFVALLVSGGHTQLVQVNAVGDYELMGESLDDAAGEAFDKTAKLLGLPYPGGPELSVLAEKGRVDRFDFPRPMTRQAGLDFSFSGLKTFAMNTWKELLETETASELEQSKADIARAFQDAVVETLLIKCRRALQKVSTNTLVIAGGVSANQVLRQRLQSFMEKQNGRVFYPRPEFCTDNGAMIAYAGCQRLFAGESDGLGFCARPRWPIARLNPLSV